MKNILIVLLFCIFGFYDLQAQQIKTANDGQLQILALENGEGPWTHLELNNHMDNFQFAIVTDRTGGHRPGVFETGVKKLNLLQPEFVLSVGDLIEGYTEDLTVLEREWNEFDGFVEALDMPFFYVPGNHDITNKVMEQVWKDRLGLTHYYFIYKEGLFLALNSEDQYRGAGRGSITTPQYEWIKTVLEEHQEVRWTLVFMHQPLWVQEVDPERWMDVEKLLSGRKHTVFAGHRHNYQKFERNNANYFMLATTGGGSPLRGPEFGEFDHVVWVTMTDEGPIMANLQLEGIWDENVMAAPTKAAIDRLTYAAPIEISPIYGAESFSKIKLTNDFDVPLKVSLNTKFSWSYQSVLEKNEIIVGPNSVEEIALSVLPRTERSKENDPVDLNIKVSYESEILPKVGVPFHYSIGRETAYELKFQEKNITIDGVMEEWSSLPLNFSGTERGDLYGEFAVSYDTSYLYIAAQITDDDLVLDPEKSSWQNDNIIFVVNADPLPKSAMQDGSGYYRGSSILAISPNEQGGGFRTYFDNRMAAGTKVACQLNDSGYFLEAAVPIEYIKEKQGKNWKSLRINLGVKDVDLGDDQSSLHVWNPNWKYVGSGMFFKK